MRVKDKNLDPGPQIKRFECFSYIQTIARRKIDRCTTFDLRFKHIRNQLGLRHQRRAALKGETVARGVQIKNPRDKDNQRQEVERDDLARQRRAVERYQSTPLAFVLQLFFAKAIRRFVIVTQHDIRSGRFADRIQIPNVNLGRDCHQSSLYR